VSARKSKPPEDRCPHCGCPEVNTYVRQNAQGVYSYTSCPGCNSFNGEPPKGREAKP
jgi:uncharacterized OB-fold protein